MIFATVLPGIIGSTENSVPGWRQLDSSAEGVIGVLVPEVLEELDDAPFSQAIAMRGRRPMINAERSSMMSV